MYYLRCRFPRRMDNFEGGLPHWKALGDCWGIRWNGWTDRDAVWGLTHVAQGTMYYIGSRTDKSIHRREGWQDGDAHIRQNSLTICYYYYYYRHHYHRRHRRHHCNHNHHRLYGRVSPVLTATGFVNGKGKNLTHYRIDTSQLIAKNCQRRLFRRSPIFVHNLTQIRLQELLCKRLKIMILFIYLFILCRSCSQRSEIQ